MSKINRHLRPDILKDLKQVLKNDQAAIAQMADNCGVTFYAVRNSILTNAPCLAEYPYFNEIVRILHMEQAIMLCSSLEAFTDIK